MRSKSRPPHRPAQCQPGSASVSSGTVPQGTVPGGAGALPGVRFLNNRNPRHPQYRHNRKWTKLDKATGEKGDDGAGILVDMDENYVYFTLPDGRTVTVPRAEGGSEPQPSVPHILYAVGQELVPGQGHYYATLWKDGKRQLLTDGSADSSL